MHLKLWNLPKKSQKSKMREQERGKEVRRIEQKREQIF